MREFLISVIAYRISKHEFTNRAIRDNSNTFSKSIVNRSYKQHLVGSTITALEGCLASAFPFVRSSGAADAISLYSDTGIGLATAELYDSRFACCKNDKLFRK